MKRSALALVRGYRVFADVLEVEAAAGLAKVTGSVAEPLPVMTPLDV